MEEYKYWGEVKVRLLLELGLGCGMLFTQDPRVCYLPKPQSELGFRRKESAGWRTVKGEVSACVLEVYKCCDEVKVRLRLGLGLGYGMLLTQAPK